MATFFVTRFGRKLLEDAIFEVQTRLKEASLEKGSEAAGQDSWHDEGYKLANVNEMMWSQRYQELKTILAQAKLTEPLEQNQKALIGNGVRIKYESGETEHCVLDGYLIKSVPNRISYLSPLGKALLNATKGSRVTFAAAGRATSVVVEEIFAPSKVELLPEFQAT